MTGLVTRFALIGRSYPSETFADLHQASATARLERRALRSTRPGRTWRASEEALIMPKRLSA
jgi:hypothetical protein